MKSSLLVCFFCLFQTFFNCILSEQDVKTISGCLCKSVWEYKNVTYRYPNNCADAPDKSGFTWCMTSNRPLPCMGSTGSTSWDKCSINTRPRPPPLTQQVELPHRSEAKERLQNEIGKTLSTLEEHAESSVSNGYKKKGVLDADIIDETSKLVDLINAAREQSLDAKSPSDRNSQLGNNVFKLPQEEEDAIIAALADGEDCKCYPGRGVCDALGSCKCIDAKRFVGSICGECGEGYSGPDCELEGGFLKAAGLLYVFCLFAGFGVCFLLTCLLNPAMRNRFGIGYFRGRKMPSTEMKEFELDSSLFTSRKERRRRRKQKENKRKDMEGKLSLRNPGTGSDGPEDSPSGPAEGVLLDFSGDTTDEELDISNSYYMLEEKDYSSSDDIMSSLNENGDLELQI